MPLTRRQFDALTKTRGGTGKGGRSGLARDEVDYYRRSRKLPLRGSGATESTFARDLLAERASERRRYPTVTLRGLQSAPKRLGGTVFLRSWGEPIRRPIQDTRMALLTREEREAMGRAKKRKRS
jgi:hypothetical protein